MKKITKIKLLLVKWGSKDFSTLLHRGVINEFVITLRTPMK